MVPYNVEVNGNVLGPLKVPINEPLIPISLTVPRPQSALRIVQFVLHTTGGVPVGVFVAVILGVMFGVLVCVAVCVLVGVKVGVLVVVGVNPIVPVCEGVCVCVGVLVGVIDGVMVGVGVTMGHGYNCSIIDGPTMVVINRAEIIVPALNTIFFPFPKQSE